MQISKQKRSDYLQRKYNKIQLDLDFPFQEQMSENSGKVQK